METKEIYRWLYENNCISAGDITPKDGIEVLSKISLLTFNDRIHINEEHIDSLKRLPKLKSIVFYGNIDESKVNFLSRLHKVDNIELRGSSNIHNSFKRLTWLKKLTISAEMKVFSFDLKNFNQLEYLNIYSDTLEELPEIKFLNKLERLILTTPKLKRISNKIGSLNKLKTLEISSNTSLPESIKELYNLENLKIEFLTDTVTMIKERFLSDFAKDKMISKLKSLSIIGLCIGEIPIWVYQNKNLEFLELYETSINEIPPKIRNFNKLKSLNLDVSNVQNIPCWLRELKHLEILQLFFNNIDSGKLNK